MINKARKSEAIAIAARPNSSMVKQAWMLLGMLLSMVALNAQTTIYSEDFSGYSNGTTSSSQWTLNSAGCNVGSSTDYFEVRANRIEARDIRCEATWTSRSIDISSYTNVSIAASLQETGSQESNDYLNLYYILDGGSEVAFATNGENYNDFGSVTAEQTGLNGSTLQIVARFRNDNGGEKHRLRDVLVEGTESVNPLSLSFNTTDVTCTGDGDGAIDLTVNGISSGGGGSGGGCTTPETTPNSCTSCTSTLSGGGNKTISSGTVCINSGFTYSGNLTMAGGTLVVCGNLMPSSLNFYGGTIIMNGTMITSNVTINSSGILKNYGTLQMSGNLTVNNQFENHGTAFISGNVQVNEEDGFYNTGAISIAGNVAFNDEDVVNSGTLTISGNMNVNSDCELINNCSITVTGNLEINDELMNNGYIKVTGGNTIVNGTLELSGGAKLETKNLIVNDEIESSAGSCALITVSSSTTINGSGEIEGLIDICDANGIENNWGSWSGGATSNCSCNATGTVSGGGSTPTYVWSNGATTEDLTGLSGGTYSVTVSYAGNSVTGSATVNEPTSLGVSLSPVHPTYGNSDGSINITVSGGTSPYTYLWSTGDTTKDLESILPRAYSVIVTDANGCSVSDSVVISYQRTSGCIAVSNGTWSGTAQWMGNCHGGGGQYPNYLDTAIISGYNITLSSNETAMRLEMDGSSMNTTSLILNGTGQLVITDDADLTNDQPQALYITTEDDAVLTIGGNINYDADDDGTTAINLNDDSRLKLAGNINRNASPNKYGSLIMANNAILELNGTNAQNLAGSTGNGTDELQYRNLEINNTHESAPQISLAGNINISNQIILNNGIVSTGSYLLTVTNTDTAAVSGYSANSYIAGSLRRYIARNRLTYTFPVGFGQPDEYHWARIENSELDGPSYLTAEFITPRSQDLLTQLTLGLLTLDVKPVLGAGMWLIEPDIQPSGGTYNIYVSTENVDDLTDNGFELVKREAGGSPLDWSLANGVIPTVNELGRKVSDGFTSLKGLSSFSEFGLIESEGGSGLPVELISFSAQPEKQEVHLKWSTATEINNDHFTVERSEDAVNFEEVTRIRGNGNSTILQEYSAIDSDPYIGTSFYRLKQTDFDGKYKYSPTLPVTVTSYVQAELSIMPNPNLGTFTLELTTPMEVAEVQILNNFGQVVHVEEIVDITGKIKVELDLKSILPKGNYFVKMDVGEDTFIKKMIVN